MGYEAGRWGEAAQFQKVPSKYQEIVARSLCQVQY